MIGIVILELRIMRARYRPATGMPAHSSLGVLMRNYVPHAHSTKQGTIMKDTKPRLLKPADAQGGAQKAWPATNSAATHLVR